MRLQYIKLFLVSVLILILLAFALPEFSFQVGSANIRYPGIGFSRIGIPRDFGSFQRSFGLFSEAKYYATVDFSASEIASGEGTIATLTDEQKWEKTKEMVKVVQARANYANLYDIQIDAIKEGSDFYITLTFPQYYQEPAQNYVQWLTATADVILYTDTASININDVTRISVTQSLRIMQGIGSNSQIQSIQVPNLALTFDKEKGGEDFLRIFATLEAGATDATSANIQLLIDGVSAFLPYADAGSGNTIKFIPTLSAEVKVVQDYLNITASYFQETKPLEFNLVFEDRVENVSPMYNPEGGAFISATVILAFAIVLAFIVRRLRVEKGLRFVFMFLLAQFSTIFILKLMIATLSVTTLVTYIICSFIIALVLYRVASTDDTSEDKESKYFVLGLSSTLLVIFAIIYKLELPIGRLTDAIGVTLVFSLVLLLLSITSFLGVNNTIRTLINSRK